MERSRQRGGHTRGLARARAVRGFSCGGREADIGARLEGLHLFADAEGARLQSALRAMRRARHQGRGYDPARHAALLRLLKTTTPPGGGGAASLETGPARTEAGAGDQRRRRRC